MKLHEMINTGEPNIQELTSLAPYLMRECPEFINKLAMIERGFGMQAAAIVTGMDILIRYIQMFDVPDDIGAVIEEVVL